MQRRFRGDSGGVLELFCEPESPETSFAQNLPLWSLRLRPTLTVGMTKIPEIPGFFVVAGISGIFPQNPAPKRLNPALLLVP